MHSGRRSVFNPFIMKFESRRFTILRWGRASTDRAVPRPAAPRSASDRSTGTPARPEPRTYLEQEVLNRDTERSNENNRIAKVRIQIARPAPRGGGGGGARPGERGAA